LLDQRGTRGALLLGAAFFRMAGVEACEGGERPLEPSAEPAERRRFLLSDFVVERPGPQTVGTPMRTLNQPRAPFSSRCKSDCASAALSKMCGATPRRSSDSPSFMRRNPLVV